MPTTQTIAPETVAAIKDGSLSGIAAIIRRDLREQRKDVPYSAVPYLDALDTLNDINDHYGLETAQMIVAYLLSNLTTYRGAVAREVKAELNRRLDTK